MHRSTAKQRILARLQQGPATTADLADPAIGGIRFGARLLELREEGYTITEHRLRQSSHRYTLIGAPARVAPPATSHPEQQAEEHAGRWHYVCDSCSHRFTHAPWAPLCPACRAPGHWLTGFKTPAPARVYVPLCEREPAAVAAARTGRIPPRTRTTLRVAA